MRISNIKIGLRVRIITRCWIDRIGTIIEIGAEDVLVDIGEPLLIRIDPESLEEMPEDPLLPGWEEFEI